MKTPALTPYFIKDKYNKHAWPPIDAILNGALGIMALLYGEGDFQKTLDYSCAFGMDADNQAATMCGLLGIIKGKKAIPKELLYPLENARWKEPFNNKYKMVTREEMDDATITGLAKRTTIQGKKVILACGGEIIHKNGKKTLAINSDAAFYPPFELNPVPELHTQVHNPVFYPLYTAKRKPGRMQISMAINGIDQ